MFCSYRCPGKQNNDAPGDLDFNLSRIDVGSQAREKRWVKICRITGTGPCKANDQCCSGFCDKNKKCEMATTTEKNRISEDISGESPLSYYH